MSAQPMQPVIETAHNPDQNWHQWVFLNGFRGRDVIVRRDSLGRKNPHAWREWLVLHCNNRDCRATGLVAAETIWALMEAAHPVPIGPTRIGATS